MKFLHLGVLFPLFLTACSGGSGGGSANSTTEPGSVYVVVDTRAGDEAIVQFQIGGATLEDAVGAQTGNLLGDGKMLTLGDLSGEPSGLRLRRVPSGDYRALHLILVPGSGLALDGNGATRPVGGPVDLRVALAEGLLHSELTSSWIVVGHDAPPLQDQGGTLVYVPTMTGRVDGEALAIGELARPVGNQGGVMTTARTVDDGLLQLSWQAGCSFEDEDGSAYPDLASFLGDLDFDDQLRVDGSLDRDGRHRTDRVRRGRRNNHPRLIGRVLELDASAERFKFRVQATARRGNREFLAVPEDVIVLAANARIEASNGTSLSFASLAVGQLAKVQWDLRTPVPGSFPEITARKIEIPGGNAGQMRPQIQGSVQSVDVAAGTITVVPRNNAQIIVQGSSVAQLLVRVGPTTTIERKPNQGGGRFPIALEDIQPGIDRIWVRGIVTGPAEIEADRVRVRED